MANAVFKLQVDTMRPALERLLGLAKDTTPVMLSMGNVFKSITEGNFNSVGSGYRPTEWKPKYDGTPSILQKTGLMAHAFVLEVSKDSATLSNPTPYAAIQQFGGTIEAKGKALRFIGPDGNPVFAKSVTIPARPFYPVLNGKLTEGAARLIERAGARAVERVVKQ
jgi:phage gpG-like protein